MASDIISPALGPPMLSGMLTLTRKGKSKPDARGDADPVVAVDHLAG